MNDVNIIENAEQRLTNIDGETIGIIYEPETAPESITKKSGIRFDLPNDEGRVKFLPLSGEMSKDEFAGIIDATSWGEAVTDCEEYLSDLKRQQKNLERKLRRKGGRS